jgi:hypothetical protein
MFGENFTTAGLFESELNIGDKFRVGCHRDGDRAADALLQARHQIRPP